MDPHTNGWEQATSPARGSQIQISFEFERQLAARFLRMRTDRVALALENHANLSKKRANFSKIYPRSIPECV